MKPPFQKWWIGAEKPEDLKYHTSWDALMQVVDKIDSICEDGLVPEVKIGKYETTIKDIRLYGDKIGISVEVVDTEFQTRIEATRQAILQFIEWHSAKKQSPLNHHKNKK